MTVNPVTGQSPEEHSATIASGMAAARATRERYIEAVVGGSARLIDVIEVSKGAAEDAKYLSKLRLYDLLRAKPGWTEQTAIEALERNGFKRSDTLASIRRRPANVTLFVELFNSTSERWRARPVAPQGWPWNGKLAALIAAAGAPMPAELDGETGGLNLSTGEVADGATLDPEEIEGLFATATPVSAEPGDDESFERDIEALFEHGK